MGWSNELEFEFELELATVDESFCGGVSLLLAVRLTPESADKNETLSSAGSSLFNLKNKKRSDSNS